MSTRQQLIEELNRQPEHVAGQLLIYLHSLPGCAVARAESTRGEDHWRSYWSKVYGSCAGMEWDEPVEQPAEMRDEW